MVILRGKQHGDILRGSGGRDNDKIRYIGEGPAALPPGKVLLSNTDDKSNSFGC